MKNTQQIIFIINRVFNHIFIILIASLEMAQTAGPISTSIIGTGKRICFAAEVDSEVPRQLHRAPTPYPKELRNLARHARNLHHQSIHDQRVSLSFIRCFTIARQYLFTINTLKSFSYKQFQ